MNHKYDNTGGFWANKHKVEDKHPDYVGKAIINGQEFELAGWKRGLNSHPQAPVVQFKIKPAQQSNKPRASYKTANDYKSMNDDTPF